MWLKFWNWLLLTPSSRVANPLCSIVKCATVRIYLYKYLYTCCKANIFMLRKYISFTQKSNNNVFNYLFQELKNFYSNGNINLVDMTDKFFTTLYQKMFQVIIPTANSSFLQYNKTRKSKYNLWRTSKIET